MAFVFGIFVNPELFGSFITASFLSLILWTFHDFGLKQRALQLPFEVDLATQKSIHFILGVVVSVTLMGISLESDFEFENTSRWILEYALITPIVAVSTPSYVKLYWNKDIRFLAIADALTQLILQPIAVLLLLMEQPHWALTISFILPYVVHALMVLYKAPIEFSWSSSFLSKHALESIKLGTSDLFSQIRIKGDTLLLSVLSSPLTVGLYNRGYALPHHASQFIQAVIQPIFIPAISNNELENHKKKTTIGILSISILFFIGYFGAKWIIQNFWIESWLPLIPLLPAFLIWGWISFLSGWHETFLKGKQENSWVIYRQLLLAVLTFIILLFLFDDLKKMVWTISLTKTVFCIVESYFVFEKSPSILLSELLGSALLLTPVLLLS